jgi:hypothetical protein
MPDELLFTVHGSTAVPATPLSLAEAGLRERQDLQEWVIAHPEIVGADVLIVTMEFDRWQSSSGRSADRLDILGLHTSGELVVTELKRDAAPDTVEMQAIKYAAMASRFTIETLAEQHAHYLSQRGAATDAESVIDVLARHAPDIDAESLRRPRIVLLASSFPPSTSATAVWLHEMGIDIALRQYRAYRTGEEISIAVSQLYPVPDVEEFMFSPRQAEVRAAAQTAQRRQEVGTVARIIAAELLEDGAPLAVRPYGINAELREQVEAWLAEDPARGRARWHNSDTEPIEWDADGGRYTPTTLGKLILREGTGIDRTLRGGDWFVDDEGRSLVQLAAQTQGELAALYLRLWSMLLEKLRDRHADWVGRVNPPSVSWLGFSASIPSAKWALAFARGARIRSELYFDNDDPGIYQQLKTRRDALETAVGSELSWEDLPTRTASRVALYRPGSIEREDEYPAYVDWFIESQERLRSAIEEVLGEAEKVR